MGYSQEPKNRTTVPFQFLCDQRTFEIIGSILQQDSKAKYGTDKVTAGKPAVVKSHLYGEFVMWIHQSPERVEELERFYRDEWLRLPAQRRSKNYSVPVRWSIQAHDALTAIAKLFPTRKQRAGNKSLAFCVILAFVAKRRYGISLSNG